MKQWIVKLWEPSPEYNCSTHRDRKALGILVRSKKRGGGAVNVRFYCLECLQNKLTREPFLPVHRPPDPSQE